MEANLGGVSATWPFKLTCASCTWLRVPGFGSSCCVLLCLRRRLNQDPRGCWFKSNLNSTQIKTLVECASLSSSHCRFVFGVRWRVVVPILGCVLVSCVFVFGELARCRIAPRKTKLSILRSRCGLSWRFLNHFIPCSSIFLVLIVSYYVDWRIEIVRWLFWEVIFISSKVLFSFGGWVLSNLHLPCIFSFTSKC